jgi:phosphatidylserine/phosphatidylglycerophosphate/cardiolipin synthase-like enzyme
MFTGEHIGHNKFAVYVDKAGKPQAVLTGSTNWTPNGMCAQSNNAVIIESPEVASAYLDYWKRLLEDTPKQKGQTLKQQGQTLRTSDMKSFQTTLDSGKTDLTAWYSPNTKAAAKPGKSPAAPPDMAEVFSIMKSAKQAVLFLVFLPGTPSIVDQALAVQQANPKLLVRGAVSDSKAMPRVKLIHRAGEEPTVVLASAIKDEFAAWHKELLKAGFAIIHDKIVVVDPFSPDCVVITGSHNLGYKASYSNDENLLIIRGNRALAQAYAVHVLDVYDHYRFRYVQQQQGKANAFSGFLSTDAGWQKPYFTAAGKAEMQNWIGP